jgi:hypothetical protein
MMTNALAKGLTGTDSRAGIGIPDSDIVSGRRVKGPRDEAGAILIFALIFLVAVGGVVGSLASWATNDLNNTSAFTNSRTLQYAVSGAVDTAMQNIRYTPLLSSTQNANPPVPCWGSASSSSVTINGSNVDVWCSTVWTPSSPNTRVVTFSACPVTAAQAGQSASTLATSCAANPNLEAVVTFGDYPSGTSAPNTAECVVYCGTSMTVNSWIWSP